VLKGWREREIQTVADLDIDTFADFAEKFKLSKNSFFKFLQIRDEEIQRNIYPKRNSS